MLALQSLLTLGLVARVGAYSASFVNPPQAGEDKDYSEDSVYKEGSTVTVSWSESIETEVPVTLALLQQALGDDEGDPSQEVLVDASIAGKTTYTWLVSTGKNLTESNVFFFELYLNKSTGPSATSHYFNISSNEEASSASTTAATTTSAAALLTTSASTTSLASATSSPAATSAAPSELSSGAKVGIGIGIAVPLSLILGAVAGWLCYKRRGGPGTPRPIAVPAESPPRELPAYYAAEPKSGNEWNTAGSLSPFGGSQYTDQTQHTYQSQQFVHAYQLDSESTQLRQAHELQ